MAIDLSVCNGYLKTLAGFSFKTVEQNVCGLRFLLRYLLERKLLTEDFASKIHMYRFAKAIDAKSRDPRIPLLLPAQLVRDDKQRDREDQPVEEAAPENKPLILHFSFPPFQHFQHVLPKTDDYIRITYTKFALESHRYFSCSKTSHRTEAPRFPLFRIAENPLTNYPGAVLLYYMETVTVTVTVTETETNGTDSKPVSKPTSNRRRRRREGRSIPCRGSLTANIVKAAL